MKLEFTPEDFKEVWERLKPVCAQNAAKIANTRLAEMLKGAPIIEISESDGNGWFGEECMQQHKKCNGCQGRTHRALLVNIEEIK